nr:zinc finger protein 436-like [Leptinotarsa decemlineata]
MNINIVFADFPKICRLCLACGDLFPILKLDVLRIFSTITDIEVKEEDRMPENMCSECIKQLEIISNFIRTCKNNDETLRAVLLEELEKALAVENENDDNDFNDVKNESDSDYSDKPFHQENVKEEIIAEPDIDNFKKENPVSCENCTENFASEKALLEHYNEIVTCRPRDFVTDQSLVNIVDYLEKEKGRRFKKIKAESDEEPEFVKGRKLKGKRRFLCNYCGKNYTRKNGLERHILSHTGVKPFECKECGKCYITKDTLKTHLLTHTGIKAHKCKVCQKSFTQSSHLSYHMRRHAGDKPHLCTFCGKGFLSSYHLERHKLMHTGVKPFECNQCGKQFVRSTTLRDHLLIHSGEKPFQCQHCGKQFNRKQSLTNHVLVHTGQSKGGSSEGAEEVIVGHSNQPQRSSNHTTSDQSLSGNPPVLTPFVRNPSESLNAELPQNICTGCASQLEDLLIFSEKCKNTETMLNNIYAARCEEKYDQTFYPDKKELYETCDDEFEQENCSTPPSSDDKLKMVWDEEVEENPYKKEKMKKKSAMKCELCDKIFYGKAAFSNHSRMHKKKRELKKFLCNYCGKNFIKNSHLDRHIRSHTGIKPYECKECSKSFVQSNDLKRHLLTHTREKVFQCPLCSKSFHQKSVMDNHLLTHVNERNIPCTICDKKFTLKAYLDVHMRTHTGMKPFKCPHCYKQFHQKSGLNNHILTHTGEKPFKCSTCSKSFIQSNHLKEHSRIHSGEKPYICSFCGKTFAYNSTLKVHLRQHTGEKPFICTSCKKGFHDSSNLRRHIHRHHTSNSKNCKEENDTENDVGQYQHSVILD